MCGIWGVFPRNKNGLFRVDMDMVKQMMLDTARRGEHSTGLFVTDYKVPTAPPTGVKVVGGPHNIVWQKELWEELNAHVSRQGGGIVGHGRQATRGKISAKNAHPFQHDHITLVHNGTLYSGVSYAKKGDTEIEVDSHALCVEIAEKGIEEALTDIHGAYAVIVHDSKEGCIYIARNKERPLHLFSGTDRHYIMSEFSYLNALVYSHNKVQKGELVKFFSEEQLYKIDLRDPKECVIVADLKQIREDKEAAKRKASYAATSSWPNYNGGVSHKTPPALPPPVPKEVVFKVLGVEQNGTQWKYICETSNRAAVHFLTQKKDLTYLGKMGKATVRTVVSNAAGRALFVKHRQIDWIEDAEEAETEVAPETGAYFLTANQKRLSVAEWEKRRVHEGCDNCCATFFASDDKKVVLTDDNKLLCFDCAATFSLCSTDRVPTIN